VNVIVIVNVPEITIMNMLKIVNMIVIMIVIVNVNVNMIILYV